MLRSPDVSDHLRCSFCRKSQDVVSRLLSSPSDSPRAYICDECVAVCAAIIDKDRQAKEVDPLPGSEEPAEPHPLLNHALAFEFLCAVERWIRQESLASDAAEEYAAMRSIAVRMIGNQS
jgi:ATP-dependent Clp protease ATP-binding subunit ClpX